MAAYLRAPATALVALVLALAPTACGGTSDAGSIDVDSDGLTPDDGDCNDEDVHIGPGEPEPCDGVDNDCDGTIDEGFDDDGDGFTTCAGDCRDHDAASYPGAFEEPD